MRTLILASAITLALGGTAYAQMCGVGMQNQSTTAQSGGMGGMGCMGMRQAADDAMADKPSSKPMMGGMMCPCCKNMASMGGGMQPDGDAPAEPKPEAPAHKH